MPKLVDHTAYRKELLEKAVEAFAQEGFGSLSMKDLARTLGISPGSFYHYFDSKEDLFLQMTAQLAQELVDYLATSLDPTESLAERVAALFDRLEARESDFRNLFLLVDDYLRIVGVRQAQGSEGVGGIFKQTHAALRNAFGVTERQADLLFTYITGIIQNRTLYRGAASFRTHKRMILHLMQGDEFSTLDAAVEAGGRPVVRPQGVPS